MHKSVRLTIANIFKKKEMRQGRLNIILQIFSPGDPSIHSSLLWYRGLYGTMVCTSPAAWCLIRAIKTHVRYSWVSLNPTQFVVAKVNDIALIASFLGLTKDHETVCEIVPTYPHVQRGLELCSKLSWWKNHVNSVF